MKLLEIYRYFLYQEVQTTLHWGIMVNVVVVVDDDDGCEVGEAGGGGEGGGGLSVDCRVEYE